MPQYIIKIVKIGFLALLPVLLISNYEGELPMVEMGMASGKYRLSSSGEATRDYIGEATFRISLEKDSNGQYIRTIVLRLESTGVENHAMEFLISEKNKTKGLPKGSYKVGSKANGFIHDFNELFGFADIKALGELPFFTERGGITLSWANDDFLRGSLALTMRNTEGKLVSLSGEFMAAAKPSLENG